MGMGTATTALTMPAVTLTAGANPCPDEDNIQYRFIVGNANKALVYENAPQGYENPTPLDSGWLPNNQRTWQIVWGSFYGGHITHVEIQIRRTSDQTVLCSKKIARNIWIIGGRIYQCSNVPRLYQFLEQIPGISQNHVTMLKAIARVETDTTHYSATAIPPIVFHKRYPVHSADNGYGVFQLTNPQPSRAQIWNWQENATGAYAILQVKEADAIRYLNAHPGYTAFQLKMETYCRYNGGFYHVWDGNAWVRNPDVICNCGNPANPRKGTLKSNPQSLCQVRGVCYADYTLTQEYNC